MKHCTRAVPFLMVFFAGIASLLASSTPPLSLYAETLNGRGNYTHLAYVCQGETIALSWEEYTDAALTLRADPAESFAPPLTERQASASGSLEVTVLGDAEVILEGAGQPDGELRIELLPESLCEAFGFPLIGWYEGTLEQTSPTLETLPRQLALYAEPYAELIGDEEKPRLYLELGEKVWAYPPFIVPCTLDVAAARLSCASEEQYVNSDPSTFQLTAQITENGLRGSYSGTNVDAGSTIPFAGTLSFDKQPGTPPREEP